MNLRGWLASIFSQQAAGVLERSPGRLSLSLLHRAALLGVSAGDVGRQFGVPGKKLPSTPRPRSPLSGFVMIFHTERLTVLPDIANM